MMNSSQLLIVVALICYLLLTVDSLYVELLAANAGSSSSSSNSKSPEESHRPTSITIHPSIPWLAVACGFHPLFHFGNISSSWSILPRVSLSSDWCPLGVVAPLVSSEHLLHLCTFISNSTDSPAFKHIQPFPHKVHIPGWCGIGQLSPHTATCNVPTKTLFIAPYLCLKSGSVEEENQRLKERDLLNELRRDKMNLQNLWVNEEISAEVDQFQNALDNTFRQTYANEQGRFIDQQLRPFVTQQQVVELSFIREELRLRRMVDYVLQEGSGDPLRIMEAFRDYMLSLRGRLQNISATYATERASTQGELLLSRKKQLLHGRVRNVSLCLESMCEKVVELESSIRTNVSRWFYDMERRVNETLNWLKPSTSDDALLEEKLLGLLGGDLSDEMDVQSTNVTVVTAGNSTNGTVASYPVLPVSSMVVLVVFNLIIILLLATFMLIRNRTCYQMWRCRETKSYVTSPVAVTPAQFVRSLPGSARSVSQRLLKRVLLVTTFSGSGSEATTCRISSLDEGNTAGVTCTSLTVDTEDHPDLTAIDTHTELHEGFENPVFQFYEKRTMLPTAAELA